MRHLALCGAMVAVAILIYAFLVFVESGYFINEYIVTTPDVSIEEWGKDFEFWARIGVALALICALAWYALGQWYYRINHWGEAGKRVMWGILFLLAGAGFVLGVYFTKPAQEGRWIALSWYVFNWLVVYYVATLFFSPVSFKYTPVGAKKVRRY